MSKYNFRLSTICSEILVHLKLGLYQDQIYENKSNEITKLWKSLLVGGGFPNERLEIDIPVILVRF